MGKLVRYVGFGVFTVVPALVALWYSFSKEPPIPFLRNILEGRGSTAMIPGHPPKSRRTVAVPGTPPAYLHWGPRNTTP